MTTRSFLARFPLRMECAYPFLTGEQIFKALDLVEKGRSFRELMKYFEGDGEYWRIGLVATDRHPAILISHGPNCHSAKAELKLTESYNGACIYVENDLEISLPSNCLSPQELINYVKEIRDRLGGILMKSF